MKHFLAWLCVSALLLAAPAFAALKTGAQAPDFTATVSLNGKDSTFSLKQTLSKGPVVVYFFPSAFTQGCDLEAHTFATQMDKFKAAGASVIGVSGDSLDRLHAFSRDPAFCAGQFPVASDADGKVARLYQITVAPMRAGLKDVRGDAVTHVLFERATYVIDKTGHIVADFSSQRDNLTPIDHVEKSLEIVTRLKKDK